MNRDAIMPVVLSPTFVKERLRFGAPNKIKEVNKTRTDGVTSLELPNREHRTILISSGFNEATHHDTVVNASK